MPYKCSTIYKVYSLDFDSQPTETEYSMYSRWWKKTIRRCPLHKIAEMNAFKNTSLLSLIRRWTFLKLLGAESKRVFWQLILNINTSMILITSYLHIQPRLIVKGSMHTNKPPHHFHLEGPFGLHQWLVLGLKLVKERETEEFLATSIVHPLRSF